MTPVKRATVVAMTIVAMAPFGTTAQEERPVAQVIAAVKEQMASQCALGRKILASSTRPIDKEQASILVKMTCDCLPGEIDRAGAELSAGRENAMTTQAAYLSRMKIAFNACSARVAREDMLARCESAEPADLGVANKKIYCECMSGKLSALDDETISTAAIAAHKNFEDKVQARLKGQPDPVPSATALDDMEKACKQATK
jgi:hypothetical protein